MDGHKKVTTPAAMPVTPQKAIQPRWTSSGSAIAADSAVMPSTNANAPHSRTRAHSVIAGPHERGEAEQHGGHAVDGEPLPATDVRAHHDVAPDGRGRSGLGEVVGGHAGEDRVDDGVLGDVQEVRRDLDGRGRVFLGRVGGANRTVQLVFGLPLVDACADLVERALHRGLGLVPPACGRLSAASRTADSNWLTSFLKASSIS